MSSEERIAQAINKFLSDHEGAAGLYTVVRELSESMGVPEADVSAVAVRGTDTFEVDWLEGQVKALTVA